MNEQIDLIEGTTRDLSEVAMAWDDQQELIPGTNRNTNLSAWFTTPELAQRVVEWAGVVNAVDGLRQLSRYRETKPMRVLEPSAGNGALVRPLVAAGAIVHAFEIDERYRADLTRETGDFGWVHMHNFLECEPSRDIVFDLCVMNPPYEFGLDVAFINHALKFAPRVVGIFTDRLLFGVERKEGLWSKVRPTRIAFQSRRPFKGAQTDYVVLELVPRGYDLVKRQAAGLPEYGESASLEWW